MMTSESFKLAQQRLIARRQHRQADARSHQAQQELSHASTVFDRIPPPLRKFGRLGSVAWNTAKGRTGTSPALRVGQIDAELLDEELLSLLTGQVGEALKYLGSHLQDDWSAEISLLLRAVLFKLTIWDHNSTYGATLQNLKYTDARTLSKSPQPPSILQKSLYGLMTVAGRYGWEKWDSWLIEQEGDYDEPTSNVRNLSQISSLLSTIHSVAALGSFVIFLVNGRYRTLLDRILRLRLSSPTSQASRQISFEYLNRQLVWHSFTEFLLFILPLIGIRRWRRLLSRAWRRLRITLINEDSEFTEDNAEKVGELSSLPERTCAICYESQNPLLTSKNEVPATSGGVVGSSQTDITNPYEGRPCGCIYCFTCLAQRLEGEEGDGWTCLRCGRLISSCKPWSGDVLESKIES